MRSAFLRLSLLSVLTLGLLATGHAGALAKGAASASGQMVLCVGGETVTVFVDGEGQPTTAPHLCSDCALAVVTHLPPWHAAVQPLTMPATQAIWPAPVHVTATPLSAPLRARAPPSLL